MIATRNHRCNERGLAVPEKTGCISFWGQWHRDDLSDLEKFRGLWMNSRYWALSCSHCWNLIFALLMVVFCLFPLKKRGGYFIEDILLLILHESTVERLYTSFKWNVRNEVCQEWFDHRYNSPYVTKNGSFFSSFSSPIGVTLPNVFVLFLWWVCNSPLFSAVFSSLSVISLLRVYLWMQSHHHAKVYMWRWEHSTVEMVYSVYSWMSSADWAHITGLLQQVTFTHQAIFLAP